MAGKPGRSGGARPGAGRKPNSAKLNTPPATPPSGDGEILAIAATYSDPVAFLKAVMNDLGSEAKLRVDAAKSLLPYMHQRMGEGGKKDAKQDAAKKAGNKFAPTAPPKLVVNNGK